MNAVAILRDMERSFNDSARMDRLEEDAAEGIREAFALRGKVPMNLIAVPSAHYAGNLRVGSETLEAVFLDVIGDMRVNEQLLAVLEKSDCALVAKLRDAVREEWIKGHAGDIAEARA